jgi:hypothetical protein
MSSLLSILMRPLGIHSPLDRPELSNQPIVGLVEVDLPGLELLPNVPVELGPLA